MRFTLIGLDKFGWLHLSHGRHSTETPMLSYRSKIKKFVVNIVIYIVIINLREVKRTFK